MEMKMNHEAFGKRTGKGTAMLLLKYTVALMSVFITGACSLSELVKVDEPQEGREIDRESLRSFSGAMSVYNSSLLALNKSMNYVSRDVGIMTDELQTRQDLSMVVITHGRPEIDSRTESRDPDGQRRLRSESYGMLQAARVRASQARYLLQEYGGEASAPYLSNTYAIEAFSILILAEKFCSGVPLTQSPFEQGVIYSEGLSTKEMLETSIALFDSALAISHDTARFTTFARIGKGRALLNLGKYDEAAEAVQEVGLPDSYSLTYTHGVHPSEEGQYSHAMWTYYPRMQEDLRVINNEGNNGLVWIAPEGFQQDPRVPITIVGGLPRQNKFPDGNQNLVVADGIHALMIRAEAALNQDNGSSPTWIDYINQARATRGIADTTNPASFDERVNLLFRERAFWFYLTGTRLGDLRRLVRQYSRSPYQIYPTGTYGQVRAIPLYGEAYVFSPDIEESKQNYLYKGCLSKNP